MNLYTKLPLYSLIKTCKKQLSLSISIVRTSKTSRSAEVQPSYLNIKEALVCYPAAPDT